MSILVIGNDQRQLRLCRILCENGYRAYHYSGDRELIEECSTVILPLPLSRDGVTVNSVADMNLEELSDHLDGKRVFYGMGTPEFTARMRSTAKLMLDYNTLEYFQYENARITALGALAMAIEELDISLIDCRAMIIGFGRIGKFLAKNLLSLGASVAVCARRDSDLAFANSLGYRTYDISSGFPSSLAEVPNIIFNTAPAKIFKRENSQMLKRIPMLDLAGNGSAVDFCGRVIPAMSLPSKFSPESAALVLYNSIKDKL